MRRWCKRLSGERAVTKDTPPTFIFQTNEDSDGAGGERLHYFLALRKAGVPAEMHVFEKGPHGVGLANDDPRSAWSTLLANWLRARRDQAVTDVSDHSEVRAPTLRLARRVESGLSLDGCGQTFQTSDIRSRRLGRVVLQSADRAIRLTNA